MRAIRISVKEECLQAAAMATGSTTEEKWGCGQPVAKLAGQSGRIKIWPAFGLLMVAA